MMESPGWPPRLSHSPWTLAESWVRRFSLCLACKPYAGLHVCPQTGRWCTSGVATRSLSLFTKRADSCSQISCLDSWCATRISKTLDVVHKPTHIHAQKLYPFFQHSSKSLANKLIIFMMMMIKSAIIRTCLDSYLCLAISLSVNVCISVRLYYDSL